MNNEHKKFFDALRESEEEWADIQKKMDIRKKKDEKIIRVFCSEHAPEDIFRTINILDKYNGMHGSDKENLEKFKEEYPIKLTLPTLVNFLDITDIYHKILEDGGETDE